MKNALGVGGLIVMVGLAFLLNALLDRREGLKLGAVGSATGDEPPR